MTAADAHRIRIFTTVRLGEREHLEAVFDALAQAKLEPTHAGEREYSLTAFERAQTVAAIVGGTQRVLELARRKAPRYTAGLRAQDAGLTSIAIDVGAHPRPQVIYELGDRLAERFRADYGVVHPVVRDGTDFGSAGNMELGWLQSYGPLDVGVRTWYGPHLAALIGEELIRAAGVATPLPWGGLRLDLVAEPWAADIDTLKQRQAEAIAALAPAQVLGDYSHPVTYKPSARWVPIPENGA
jgi:hypothetical protein